MGNSLTVSSSPFVLEKKISEGLTGGTWQVESLSFSPFSLDSLSKLIAPFTESFFGRSCGHLSSSVLGQEEWEFCNVRTTFPIRSPLEDIRLQFLLNKPFESSGFPEDSALYRTALSEPRLGFPFTVGSTNISSGTSGLEMLVAMDTADAFEVDSAAEEFVMVEEGAGLLGSSSSAALLRQLGCDTV